MLFVVFSGFVDLCFVGCCCLLCLCGFVCVCLNAFGCFCRLCCVFGLRRGVGYVFVALVVCVC